MKAITFGALFTAAVLCCAGAALGQTEAEDNRARTALAEGQFERVVQIYAGYESAKLNDRALYRLAIALQRQGKSEQAGRALSLAMAANPSGTFASTPERLASLREAILKAAPLALGSADAISQKLDSALGAPVPPAPQVLAPEAELQGVVSPTVPPPATPTASAAAAIISPASGDAQVSASAGLQSLYQLAAQLAESPQLLAIIAAAIAVLILALARLAYAWRDRIRLPKGAMTRREAARWQRQVEAARRQIADIRFELMGAANNSILYEKLTEALEELEREAGRSNYWQRGGMPRAARYLTHSDRAALEFAQNLQQQPLRVSTATAAQVVALFQNDFGLGRPADRA